MYTVLIASCSVSLHGITTLESSLVRLDYYQTHGLAHTVFARSDAAATIYFIT